MNTRSAGALAMLGLTALIACGADDDGPQSLTSALATATAEWIPGWQQPGVPYTVMAADRFEQSRGSEIRYELLLPEHAVIRGQARLRESHDRRKSRRPVHGRASVTLIDRDGVEHTLVDVGYSAPGDTLSFSVGKDVDAFAGQRVSLVLRLGAGPPGPKLGEIHKRLRLIWTGLRVDVGQG